MSNQQKQVELEKKAQCACEEVLSALEKGGMLDPELVKKDWEGKLKIVSVLDKDDADDEGDISEAPLTVLELLVADQKKMRDLKAKGKANGMRWNPDMIEFLLFMWDCAGKRAIKALGSINNAPLPTLQTLAHYRSKRCYKSGMRAEVLEDALRHFRICLARHNAKARQRK